MNENETMTNNEEKVLDAEEQLKEMMKTMVPKSELDKSRNDYNRLYNKVLNGEFSGRTEPEKDTGKELEENFKSAMKQMAEHQVTSACDHAKNLLVIDDYLISKGQRSVFEASDGDRDFNGAAESAKRTRELLEYALEEANGDDNLFTARISNVLRDVATSRK